MNTFPINRCLSVFHELHKEVIAITNRHWRLNFATEIFPETVWNWLDSFPYHIRRHGILHHCSLIVLNDKQQKYLRILIDVQHSLPMVIGIIILCDQSVFFKQGPLINLDILKWVFNDALHGAGSRRFKIPLHPNPETYLLEVFALKVSATIRTNPFRNNARRPYFRTDG